MELVEDSQACKFQLGSGGPRVFPSFPVCQTVYAPFRREHGAGPLGQSVWRLDKVGLHSGPHVQRRQEKMVPRGAKTVRILIVICRFFSPKQLMTLDQPSVHRENGKLERN